MGVAAGGDAIVDKAYAKAGGIATESLFSMRTIVSLGIETDFVNRYQGALVKVRRTTIVNNTLLYFSGGLTLSSYLVMMGVAIVYGSYRLAGEMEWSSFPLVVTATYPG